MALYKYYQRVGGSEPWQLTRAETDLTDVKPTFVTILNLDTLDTLPAHNPPKELLDAVKYYGPMYFDLDANDVQESIDGANELITKLKAEGIQDSDMEIYLSGKKGLHIIISPVVFMEKQQPVQFLPAIYKEMAFRLAVDTVDFRVYTARSGRLLRTNYNQRENGNYRVPVTAEQLRDLTPAGYNQLCQVQRFAPASTPSYRPAFALIYDAAKQKVAKYAHKKAKPVDAPTLALHLPLVQQIMRGEVAAGVGFNKVAIQLAIYARDSGMTEDALVQACQGLINSHSGDGNRYDTPAKREIEIRRMVSYVESNSSYEYASSALKALLPRVTTSFAQYGEDGQPLPNVEISAFTAGVTEFGNQYLVSKGGDAGDVPVTNFVFGDISKLVDIATGEMIGLRTTLMGLGSLSLPIIMEPAQFTGSSGLQNAVSKYGGSFTGSDIHARGILQIMIHKASDTRYVIDSEGVNVVNIPMHENPKLREPFVVWADASGVRTPDWVTDLGITFDFSGHPDPLGEMKTDLTLAPTLPSFVLAAEGNKELLMTTVKALFTCQEADTLGKFLGWMVSTFWRQQFHKYYGKFPLMHVYGPAGLGKSEMTSTLLKLFFYRADAPSSSPSSTPYAFLNMVGSSASIPVMLDEYKPSKMNSEQLEKYKGYFRGGYNMQETQRGGGNRTKQSFNALSRIRLSGPIVFIAEAPEMEEALRERVVLVSIRKPTPKKLNANFQNFLKVQDGLICLPSLGHTIALEAVNDSDMSNFHSTFDRIYNKAIYKMITERAGLVGTVVDGVTITSMVPRVVFNGCVAVFGLLMLKRALKSVIGEEFETHFGEVFALMQHGIFNGSGDNGITSSPEYVRLLTTMGDMTMLPQEDRLRLVEGLDYNLSEIGGMPVLALVPRAAYTKYRMYCKSAGMEHYFHNEHAFTQAMREVPQFLHAGKGTTRAPVQTLIFNLEDLQRSGMSRWAGKPVNLP